MDSEALFTFLYESPGSVQQVELLGSWDNFTKPYPMERDLRRSSRHWVGCFRFDEITCDGSEQVTRSGGLKQGQCYWYFYRINGDVEITDPSRPTTSACPLLPGMRMNELMIPILDPASVPMPAPMSLNPADRYGIKPTVPKLNTSAATTVVRCPESLSHSPDRMRHPWSANGVPASPISVSSTPPRSKSATSSPSSAIKSAFQHLKGSRPSAAWDEDRGRSRSKRGPAEPSIGPPVLVSHNADHMPIPISPASSAQTARKRSPPRDLAPPFSPLRCHPITQGDQDAMARNTLEMARADLRSQDESVPEPLSRPAETSPVKVPSPLRRWASQATAESASRSRSHSSGRSRTDGRNHSPLRNEVSLEAERSMPAFDVPADINETDCEAEETSAPPMPVAEAWPLPNEGLPDQSPPSSSPKPNLDKALPELPPSIQLAAHDFGRFRLNVEGNGEPGSHFSVWTYDSVDTEEAIESPTSPTFSSTATCSSFGTPGRWSMQSTEEHETAKAELRHLILPEPEAGESTTTLTAMEPVARQLSNHSASRRQAILFDSVDRLDTYSLPVDETPKLSQTDEEELRAAVADLHLAVNGDKRDPTEQIIDDFAYVGGLL